MSDAGGAQVAEATRICSIEGCGRAPTSKGMCDMHYRRVRRGSIDPSVRRPPGKPFVAINDDHAAARSLIKTALTDTGCMEFQGGRLVSGYGQIRVGTRANGAAVMRLTHRLVWAAFNGPIPAGHYICHQCDNPPCINPAHLFLGTPQDNAVDRDRKGRNWNGQGAKTHCPAGHEYDAVITRTNGKTYRACSICRADATRRSKERRRGVMS